MADTMTWESLPKQPWPEGTEAPAEALADWLTRLTREQLVWVLDRQQATWSRESRCFRENHDGRVEHAEQIIREAADRWQLGYNQGLQDARHLVDANLAAPADKATYTEEDR